VYLIRGQVVHIFVFQLRKKTIEELACSEMHGGTQPISDLKQHVQSVNSTLENADIFQQVSVEMPNYGMALTVVRGWALQR
jgi:hypothetical protein